jgi:hypothetical protein
MKGVMAACPGRRIQDHGSNAESQLQKQPFDMMTGRDNKTEDWSEEKAERKYKSVVCSIPY